ncbi:MAG: TonB-dependent receptor [Verrucomicrobiota bacterium]
MIYRPSSEQAFTVSVSEYLSIDQGGANPQTNVDPSGNPFVGRTIDYMQWTGNWEFNPAGNDLVDIDATFYYNTTNQVRNYLDTTGPNIGRQNMHELEVFGIDFRNRSIVDIGNKQHEFVYGIDFFTESQMGTETRDTFFGAGGPGTSSGRPDADADHFAAYITDEIEFTDELTIFTGIRFDTYETMRTVGSTLNQSDSALSPHIGFNLELNKNWSISGQYSRAFTQPTLNDLYQDGSHFGIVPLIDPEEVAGAFGRFEDQEATTFNVNQPFLVVPPFGPPIPAPNNIEAPDFPDPVTQEEAWFEEVFIPNPNLLPEESDNFELSIHYENDDVGGGQLSARLTGFYQKGENTFDSEIVGTTVTDTSILGFEDIPAVEPVSFPGPNGPFAAPTTFLFPTGGGLDFDSTFTQAFRQTVNREETEIYGAEFVLDYDREDWFSSLSYGTVRGYDTVTGMKLNTTTGDQFSATFGVRPVESIEIGVYGIWNEGREDRVSDVLSKTGAYDIYGIFAAFQATEIWTIRVGVDNLFDQGYERSNILQEEPGRNVVLSSTAHW